MVQLIDQQAEVVDGYMEPIARLTADLLQAARELGPQEVRYLVDNYYAIQEYRKALGNQLRDLVKAGEPGRLMQWLFKQSERLEGQIKRALDAWTDDYPVGRWQKSIYGIGPVLAAGFMAHINIEKAPTAGHIWRFAGLDPAIKWLGKEGAQKILGIVLDSKHGGDEEEADEYVLTPEEIKELDDLLGPDGDAGLTYSQLKHISVLTNRRVTNIARLARDKNGRITRKSVLAMLAKRPWNADLKVLCWKAGQCFMKFHNHPDDIYGKFYIQRKDQEWELNLLGKFVDQARARAETVRKETESYAWYAGHYALPEGVPIADLVQIALYGTDAASGAEAIKAALVKVEKDGLPMLPPAHIDARARRYAVKLYLSHLHHVMYESRYGGPPPKPYVITKLGHAHYIEPPNWKPARRG